MKDVQVKNHVDGIWNTSEYEYKGHKIEIKSRDHGGIKGHCFSHDGTKVLFTLRFNFCYPGNLLTKMKFKLDKLLTKTTK